MNITDMGSMYNKHINFMHISAYIIYLCLLWARLHSIHRGRHMGEKAVIPSYSIVGRIERQVYPR
jgi:hypothetical protein